MTEPLSVTVDAAHQLGDAIRQSYEERALALPGLVVIPRSGYLVGELISRQWGVPGVDMLHACVRKKEQKGRRKPSFEVGQFPTRRLVKDRPLVVLDAVRHTGDTIGFVQKRLLDLGAASVESAVLYDRSRDDEEVRNLPSFVVAHRTEFTIFEWEKDEHLPLPQ